MRTTQLIRLLKLALLLSSSRVAAKEPLTHWGFGLGMEVSNIITPAPEDARLLGFTKFSGIFSVGNLVSLDLSTGLLIAKKDETQPNASPAYVLGAAEGYLAPQSEDQRYGLTLQGEFSLDGNRKPFDERRFMVGPTAKFKLDDIVSNLKLKLAAGYVGSWLPNAYNHGFAITLTGEYMH